MSPFFHKALTGTLALVAFSVLLGSTPRLRGEEGCLLRLAFGTRSAVISGRVDSDAVAEALASAVSQARPDLTVDRSGLQVDPSVAFEALPEWRSLISELGLSTHEGLLEYWPDRLVLGGLTDSLVTRSALFIRAAPLLRGRRLHDRICLVGTEDLPEIDVSLARPQTTDAPGIGGTPAAAPPPPSSLDLAGISLAKLLPTLRMLSTIGNLSTSATPGSVSPGDLSLRAMPLEANPAPAVATPTGPVLAEPLVKAETLPSILFSRNSFLLQANQVPVIDAIAKQLLSPAYAGALVRIEAVKASGGSTAFNEYLCERRSAEVSKLLLERGLDDKKFTLRTVQGGSGVDAGEVRILAELPPPPDPEPAVVPAPADGTAPDPPAAATATAP